MALIRINAFPSLVQAQDPSFPERLIQVVIFSSPSPYPPPCPLHRTGKSCQCEFCRLVSSACNFPCFRSSSAQRQQEALAQAQAALCFSSSSSSPPFSSLAPGSPAPSPTPATSLSELIFLHEFQPLPPCCWSSLLNPNDSPILQQDLLSPRVPCDYRSVCAACYFLEEIATFILSLLHFSAH